MTILPPEVEGLFTKIIGGALAASQPSEPALLLAAGEATACIEDDAEPIEIV